LASSIALSSKSGDARSNSRNCAATRMPDAGVVLPFA
jgi:hypothetical protein